MASKTLAKDCFDENAEVEKLFRHGVADPADVARRISRAMGDWKLVADRGAAVYLRRKLSAAENTVYAAEAGHAADLFTKALGQETLVRSVMSAESEGRAFNLADSYHVTKADVKAVFARASLIDMIEMEAEEAEARESGLVTGSQAVRLFEAYLERHKLQADDDVKNAVVKNLREGASRYSPEAIEDFAYRLSMEALRRAVAADTDINCITMPDLDALSGRKAERARQAEAAVSRLAKGEGLGAVLKDVLPKSKR